jgi:hypothetical protein
MKPDEIKEKVLKGGQLAIDRLIERKLKEKSYIVVSDRNGGVVKLYAADIKR